jgi:sodium transport system ATP-binding protein
LIIIENVSKSFKTKKVLEQVSLTVRRGEVIGLLGENGAGKTTLLRMLSTVLAPTEGTIRVAGFDTVRQQLEVRRRIGILFGGETGLYNRLTARENIYYFGHLYEIPRARLDENVSRLVHYFGLDAFLDKKVGEFSKGMRQKVAIARSVIHDPDIILLDEPTSGLDVTSAFGMRNLIGDMKARGKTIVFSSHIMEEVKKLCDRVVMIHHGKVKFDGPLEPLFAEREMEDLEHIFMSMIGEDK